MDDFSDGDLNSNPQWTGELVNFETAADIVDLDNSLHLNAPVITDTSYLTTPSVAINNASWEFTVMLDFGTSSSNFADVYLSSDQSDLEADLNGYFVRVGNSSDEVSLYNRTDQNISEIIDGTDAFISSDPVNVRIKVTRDDLGNWELSADNSGGSNYVTQGAIFDNDHLTSSFFGVFCKYTSTRSDLFYFDDIDVSGSPFVDNVPPTLEGVLVVTNQSLRLQFSEPIAPGSVSALTNYFVDNGIGMPTAAVLSSPDEIDLSFSNAFENGTVYEINVTGVTDINGNNIGTASEEFFFFFPGTAQEGDVIFNETFADPTPSQGLPEVEYVELYNRSNEDFDLENWIFVNTTTEKTLPTFPLLQNAFVILCDEDDVALMEPFGDVIGIPSFTALSNSGDSLTLRSNSALVIDALVYSDDWYDDPDIALGGYSLERINPNSGCSSAINWAPSMNSNGGTPGTLNSVFDDTPDTTVPVVLSYEIEDPQSILVVFSEPMDEVSLEFGNYNIDNGIDVLTSTLVGNFDDRIRLGLSSPLDASTTYQLTVSNVFDCEGNNIGSALIELLLGFAPQIGEIIFTEIMADPSPVVGLPNAEYVEIYNTSDKLINLSDCSIDGSFFPANTFLATGEYLIAASSDNALAFFAYDKYVGLSSWSSIFLSNSGETLELRNAVGELINCINYDPSVHDANKDEGGWSLEMINLNEPCRGIANWSSSAHFQGGTPGEQNSVFSELADEEAPRLLDITVMNDQQILLHFDEVLDSLSIPLIEIDNGLNDILSEIVSPLYNAINVFLDAPMQIGSIYTLNISEIFDCSGNGLGEDSSGQFALPEESVAGDLVINEILFNPPEGASDFVEIYNNSNKVISLKDWRIANIENGMPDNLTTISEIGKLIFPGTFLALTSNEKELETAYPMGNANNFLELSSLPAYNNDEGTVVLLKPSAEVSDEFYYQEDYHFALLDIVKGFSLERIDPKRVSNDPSNWHSASTLEGGATPGKMNSQFFQSSVSENSIQLEPEIITPDNDGFEDFLNINYLFDEPGFIVNMDIFDSRGVLVKELLRNELLGTSGIVKWDGSTDGREKARIGVYVIFIEIFDVEGNVSHFKKTCVVGSGS